MIIHFEYEDERGILHQSSMDAIATAVSGLFPDLVKPATVEAIYITRYSEGYVYEGTVHALNDFYHFQIVDNNLYYVADKDRNGFKRGGRLEKCETAKIVSLRNYI